MERLINSPTKICQVAASNNGETVVPSSSSITVSIPNVADHNVHNPTIVDTSIFNSPLRREMKGHDPRDNDKLFGLCTTKSIDGVIKDAIEYRTAGSYTTKIDRGVMDRIISCSYTNERGLHNVVWVGCSQVLYTVLGAPTSQLPLKCSLATVM